MNVDRGFPKPDFCLKKTLFSRDTSSRERAVGFCLLFTVCLYTTRARNSETLDESMFSGK
jgi:hypothetical protein